MHQLPLNWLFPSSLPIHLLLRLHFHLARAQLSFFHKYFKVPTYLRTSSKGEKFESFIPNHQFCFGNICHQNIYNTCRVTNFVNQFSKSQSSWLKPSNRGVKFKNRVWLKMFNYIFNLAAFILV